METRLATPDERAANVRALNRLRRFFPRLPKSRVGEFLIENTAYPFAPIPYCVEQCADLSRRAHKDVTRAYIISDEDITKEMRRINARQQQEPKP